MIGHYYQVYSEASIPPYIVNIIQEKRNNHQLLMEASPRAGEHLFFASKAYALIQGYEYVIPDDVKAMCPKVLSHRIVKSTEPELVGISTKKILDDILSKIEIPDLFQTEENQVQHQYFAFITFFFPCRVRGVNFFSLVF